MLQLSAVDIALVVAAAVIALVAPLLAWKWPGARQWGPALGVGGGYILIHHGIARPAFPPLEVTDRLPALALAALVLGMLESVRPGPGWTRWENRLIVTALTLWAVLGPILANSEDLRGDSVRLAGIGLVILASWGNLEALATRENARTLGPPFAAIAGGAGAVFLLSGSAILGFLAAGLAAALAFVWLASWPVPTSSYARGAAPVMVTVLATMLLLGTTYAETPVISAGLLAASPLALWVGRISPLRRLGRWAPAVFGLATVLLPVGAAVAVAWSASPEFEG